MNAQQAENLRVLIRHMETKPVERLDMTNVFHPCGTPACAMGHAKAMGLVERDQRIDRAARDVFGLSEFEGGPRSWDRLFGADLNGDSNPTPLQWAAEARKVLAEHGYSMDGRSEEQAFAQFKAKLLEPVKVSA